MRTDPRRIVFGATADAAIDRDLPFICEVDRAHLAMLCELRLVAREPVQKLLKMIGELAASNFQALRGRPAPRGLFLQYETYLVERLGAETAGVLRTARSRNDLNAAVALLRLRAPYAQVLRECLHLQGTLLRQGVRFAEVVMPAYTHYQAAVPITYGHYLIGIASALDRDITALLDVHAALDCCPLGAGAVGGTSWPIDTARTASLLGFSRPVQHSVDAVASRDAFLRVLSQAAVVGVLLSRLATDLLIWSSREFQFIELPEELLGGSSMMPQKRNAFFLEYIQGRSATALGAFVTSAAAMRGTQFTNAIAVSHEGTAPIWEALQHTTDALVLARVIVDGARPVPDSMLERAVEGETGATYLADQLVRRGRLSYRSAHELLRQKLSSASDADPARLPGIAETISTELGGPPLSVDPTRIALSSTHGGGPGCAASVATSLRERWKGHQRTHVSRTRAWRRGARRLEKAVHDICTQIPLHVTADRETSLPDWLRAHSESVLDRLTKHGAILFRGFRVPGPVEFQKAAEALCPDLYEQYGDLPATPSAGRVYGATPYPSAQRILFHNEASHTGRWPLKQWFYCAIAAESGGCTPLASMRAVTAALDRKVLDELRRRRLMYIRRFTPGLDVDWKDFFKTDDRAVVEQRCREQGFTYEWRGDGLETRRICDAVVRHPTTGEELFFNQVQLHHPSCLPPHVREAMRSIYAEEELPRDVRFADGSPIADELVDHVREVYDRVAVRFDWQAEDVLLLDNVLIAHGRDTYTGPRQIYVALAQMCSESA